LHNLSVAFIEKKNKAKIDARKTMIKKPDDLPDCRIEKGRIKAAKEVENVFESNKSKN